MCHYNHFLRRWILTIVFIPSICIRNPNEGRDNDGMEGGETLWETFTVPDLKYIELNLGLPTKRAYRASFCQFWNSFIPQVVTTTGNVYKRRDFAIITLKKMKGNPMWKAFAHQEQGLQPLSSGKTFTRTDFRGNWPIFSHNKRISLAKISQPPRKKTRRPIVKVYSNDGYSGY